jgi:sugar-specific transcriptional regulator TrmB
MQSRPDLFGFFSALGLTRRQSRLYMAGLTYGQQPASELAKRISAPRTSVYQDLNRLVIKGVFTKKKHRSLTYFNPISIENLGYLIQGKIAEAKKLANTYNDVSELLSNYSKSQSITSDVEFYDGLEGLARLLDECSKTDQTVLYMSGHNCMDLEFRKYLFESYLPLSSKHNNKNKIILNEGRLARDYQRAASKVYDEFIFVDPDTFEFETTIAVYGNKVAFCSYDPNDLSGVVITNERISNDMRKHFYILKNYFTSPSPTP